MPWKLLVRIPSLREIRSRDFEASSYRRSSFPRTSGKEFLTFSAYFFVCSRWLRHSLPSVALVLILSLWATFSTSIYHFSLETFDWMMALCAISASIYFASSFWIFPPPKSKSSSISSSESYAWITSARSAPPSISSPFKSSASSSAPAPSSFIIHFLNLNLFLSEIYVSFKSTWHTSSPYPVFNLLGGMSRLIPRFLSSIRTFWLAVMGSSYLFQPLTWWLLTESSHDTRLTKYMNCSEAFDAYTAKKLLEIGLKPLR